jgi:predicted transcriptional regulator of viral defense system
LGLTDQVFQTIVVKTTNRVRSGNQKLLDYEYLVGNVDQAKTTWGLRAEWIEDTRVHFADEARIIIDILDDPSIGGGIRHCADILSNYMAEQDSGVLLEYGESLGNAAVFKRLGFLCETLRLSDDAFLKECERRLSAGVAVLDPSLRRAGSLSPRWQVRVNARIELLAAS